MVNRPIVGDNSPVVALPVMIVGESGSLSGGKFSYTLLNNATATGAGVGPISGGDYIWRAEAAAWNAATATLQYLGLDGATWNNVKTAANADVTLSANGQIAIGVGEASILRVLITGGPPVGARSNLAGL